MAKIIEIKQPIPALYLTWIINNICTNACDYCPSNVHNGTNHNYDWDHARSFIEKLFKRYTKINLAISGGEPTISPWFKDLVKMFSDSGHPVGVTTNGARTVSYFEDVSKYLSYVVMSYHPSFEDPQFIEKALACAKNTSTTISVMMDSRHFDKSVTMYNKLKSYRNINIEAIRVFPWWGGNGTVGCDYTSAQIEFMKNLARVEATSPVIPKNPGFIGKGATVVYDDGTTNHLNAQQLINNKETDFQGWECDIGLHSLYIKPEGRVRLANCITSLFIGWIQESDDIQWPTTSFTCKQNTCNCATDVYVSKRKV
jgi:organic radical activating enzyme